jgi:hypothetical protein
MSAGGAGGSMMSSSSATSATSAMSSSGSGPAANPYAVVQHCDVSEEDRHITGCGRQNPEKSCTTYDLKVIVDPSVAEVDPDAIGADGNPLHEAVWVDYFADGGDFHSDVRLVSDPVSGYVDDHESEWIPPAEKGLVTVWAVVHDSRGGVSTVQRIIDVE